MTKRNFFSTIFFPYFNFIFICLEANERLLKTFRKKKLFSACWSSNSNNFQLDNLRVCFVLSRSSFSHHFCMLMVLIMEKIIVIKVDGSDLWDGRKIWDFFCWFSFYMSLWGLKQKKVNKIEQF